MESYLKLNMEFFFLLKPSVTVELHWFQCSWRRRQKYKMVNIQKHFPCIYIVCSDGGTSIRLQVKRLDIFDGFQSLKWRFICSTRKANLVLRLVSSHTRFLRWHQSYFQSSIIKGFGKNLTRAWFLRCLSIKSVKKSKLNPWKHYQTYKNIPCCSVFLEKPTM